MSGEQGGVGAAFVAINAAFKHLGWNMTPVHMLRDALERAELDRDEAIESWQYWRAHGDRELRARAEEAERALAEILDAKSHMNALGYVVTADEAQELAIKRARAALRPSEDTSDES